MGEAAVVYVVVDAPEESEEQIFNSWVYEAEVRLGFHRCLRPVALFARFISPAATSGRMRHCNHEPEAASSQVTFHFLMSSVMFVETDRLCMLNHSGPRFRLRIRVSL
jgi:hypothetical protein